jgi:hypothetical protein
MFARPNAAGNAGWRSQFLNRGGRHQSRVPELWTLGAADHAMKQITRTQIYALWFCVVYLVGVMAFTREGSQFTREGSQFAFTWQSQGLRQTFASFTSTDAMKEVAELIDNIARFIRLQTVLMGAGVLMLLSTVIWIARRQPLAHD